MCRIFFGLATMLAISAIGCGENAAPVGQSCGKTGCAGPFDALVVVSDYMSSEVGAIALDGGTAFWTSVDLGADPALSVSRGCAFLLARDIGTFFDLDPRTGTPLPGGKYNANDPDQPGTSDPYDVAVAPDGSLWIVRYDTPTLLILAADGSRKATIDLSSYGSDGNPQASAIRIVDGIGDPPASKAFVALQRLDPMLEPDEASMMLRIDVATETVEAQIPLAGWNAFTVSEYDESAGALYIAESGSFQVAGQPNAGIERFDVASSTSTMLIAKDVLGDTPVEVAVTSGCGVVIVADASPANLTSLLSFDPASGTVLRTKAAPILATPGYFLQGLAWIGDSELLVGEGDPTMPLAAKIHVFDRTGACTLTERATTLPVPLKAIAIHATM